MPWQRPASKRLQSSRCRSSCPQHGPGRHTSRMVMSWLALYWAITLLSVSCSAAQTGPSGMEVQSSALRQYASFRRNSEHSCMAHLDDGGQHALCIVSAQGAVDLWQLGRHRPREHSQPYVHLQTQRRGFTCSRCCAANRACMQEQVWGGSTPSASRGSQTCSG